MLDYQTICTCGKYMLFQPDYDRVSDKYTKLTEDLVDKRPLGRPRNCWVYAGHLAQALRGVVKAQEVPVYAMKEYMPPYRPLVKREKKETTA